MRLQKIALLMCLVFVVSACATQSNGRTGQRDGICAANKNTRLNRPECIKAVYEQNYEYALLAAIAYGDMDDRTFNLPEGYSEAKLPFEAEYNKNVGLEFTLFERENHNGEIEYILAFQGSRQWWHDWILKNALGFSKQHKAALDLYRNLEERLGPLAVTGDSLGGALAIQIGLCRNVRYRSAVNASPRISTKYCSEDDIASKTVEALPPHFHLSEEGQALKGFEQFVKNDQLVTHINCFEASGLLSMFIRHDGVATAGCIVLLAAETSEEAANYVKSECETFEAINRRNSYNSGIREMLARHCPDITLS